MDVESSLPMFAQASTDLDTNRLIDAPVEQVFRVLLEFAINSQASDLFVFSNERNAEISLRRFGKISSTVMIPLELGRQLTNYIKTRSNLDITETRRPQDGRWIFRENGLEADLRISVISTHFGEDLAIRLSDGEKTLPLDKLGLTREQESGYRHMLSRSGGLILVTGPTGTGKTTTLYSSLKLLNDGTRKINTIEDPVESVLGGVRQSQVNPAIGLEFNTVLRSVLRQNPDIIMIGEIRDEETAQTAVRAAGSGHLVLATLHTETTVGAIRNMQGLGINPYFLATTLIGVVAQKLGDELCPNCRVPVPFEAAEHTFAEIKHLLQGAEGRALYRSGEGCSTCAMSGYIGRKGIFELLTIDSELRRLIEGQASIDELRQVANGQGQLDFRLVALQRIARGDFSVEEIVRGLNMPSLV